MKIMKILWIIMTVLFLCLVIYDCTHYLIHGHAEFDSLQTYGIVLIIWYLIFTIGNKERT